MFAGLTLAESFLLRNQASLCFRSHGDGCSAEKIHFHMDWKMKGALPCPVPPMLGWLTEPWPVEKTSLFLKADIVPNFCLCMYNPKMFICSFKRITFQWTENTEQDRNLATASCNLRATVCISPWNRLTLLGHSFSLSIPLLNPFNTYPCCSKPANYYEI